MFLEFGMDKRSSCAHSTVMIDWIDGLTGGFQVEQLGFREAMRSRNEETLPEILLDQLLAEELPFHRVVVTMATRTCPK
jgi:hypothetical protein